MEIQIKKAILHILDLSSECPLISNSLLDISDSCIENFIVSHINKIIYDPNSKNAMINKNCDIHALLRGLNNNFKYNIEIIAQKLFCILKEQNNIPNSDVLFVLFEADNVMQLAIIKLNYSKKYTHYIQQDGNGISNKIIQHQAIYPATNQKIDEAAIINLHDDSVLLIEKEYFIDGEKQKYFSNKFLNVETSISPKESLKIMNNITNEMSHKYFNGDFRKQNDVKEVIYKSASINAEIEIDTVANKVFGNNETVKKEYIAELKKSGIKDKIKMVQQKIPYKKFKLKTDTGIELNIPMDLYRDKNSLEVVNNPDGTYSIIIKNIAKIQNQ